MWDNTFVFKNKKMRMLMDEWYRSTNKHQKIFLYAVSVLLVLVYGIGFLFLSILIYLELGVRGGKKDLEVKRKEPDCNDSDGLREAEGAVFDDFGDLSDIGGPVFDDFSDLVNIEKVEELRSSEVAQREVSRPPAIKNALGTAWAWMSVLLIILVVQLLYPLLPFIESGGDPEFLVGVGRAAAETLMGTGLVVITIPLLVFFLSLIKNIFTRLF